MKPTRAAAFEPFCHEAVLRFDRPVGPVVEALSGRGVLAGYDLAGEYPELGNALLVCATEMRTEWDIQIYADSLRALLAAPAAT